MGMSAHLPAVCGLAIIADWMSAMMRTPRASVQMHVYMCIDEMTRLVNRRVVLDLPGVRTTSDRFTRLIMLVNSL